MIAEWYRRRDQRQPQHPRSDQSPSQVVVQRDPIGSSDRTTDHVAYFGDHQRLATGAETALGWRRGSARGHHSGIQERA